MCVFGYQNEGARERETVIVPVIDLSMQEEAEIITSYSFQLGLGKKSCAH